MKFSWLTFLLALCAVIFSLFQFAQTRDALQNSQQNLLQVEEGLNTKIEDLQKQQLAQTVQTRQQAPSKATGPERDQVSHFEIALLIQLAETQLHTRQDLGPTLSLLNTAHSKIQALHDPQLEPLQAAIQNDQQALAKVQPTNPEGAWQSITTLIDETQDLLPGHQRSTLEPALQHPPASVYATTWKTLLDQLLQTFKDLIKIQRHTKPVEPLLSDTEQRLVQQQLRLLLEQLRLTTMMRNESSYTRLIQDTQQWLLHYYDAEDPRVLSLQQSLNTLKTVSLENTYPPLTCLHQLSLLRS
jgi:uncharacterized protein HemX